MKNLKRNHHMSHKTQTCQALYLFLQLPSQQRKPRKKLLKMKIWRSTVEVSVHEKTKVPINGWTEDLLRLLHTLKISMTKLIYPVLKRTSYNCKVILLLLALTHQTRKHLTKR